MPDLFLTMTNGTTSYYRAYVQRASIDSAGVPSHRYCLTSTQDQIVASGTEMPLIELQDFNRDGMIDIAFFTTEGYLTVLYNEYDTPSAFEAGHLCGDTTASSILASKSMFPFYPYTQSANILMQKIASPKPELTLIGLASSAPSVTTT